MSVKDSMNKWATGSKRDIDIAAIKKTCDSIGVKGEELDACILLGTEFESGEMDETHFLVWLGELIHKSPEEVEQLLRQNASSKPENNTPKEYYYKTWLGEKMDNKLWELITRDENPESPTDSPFYIKIASTEHNRYLPVNPQDPAWPEILKELEK